MLKHVFNWQFLRYGIIGVFNTILSLAIFNAFILLTGITKGPYISLFSAVTFAVVITHAFLWNKFFVFRAHKSAKGRREYSTFFLVTGTVALINVGIISLLVNVMGAPAGISAHLWANIAVLCTVPVSVLGNFSGYKLLVFKNSHKQSTQEMHRLLYIANARIPTEKAHGLTIVKSCEAFARQGIEVVLIIPRRKTQFEGDIFETYGVERIFAVRYMPTIDLLRWSQGRVAFWMSYATFYFSTFFALLLADSRNTVVYTRESPLLLLSFLGLPAVFECHQILSRRKLFFMLARSAKGIVTISYALKNAFLGAGFKDERLLVAPSGFDPSIFSHKVPKERARRELNLPEEQPIALYTGNFTTMSKDKGISDILKALTKLPEVLFVAVGGSEGDMARYNKEAEELGVGARTRFFGHTVQKTLALYQCAADVLLMPFPDLPHYRNHMSPVKMFEYMASGKPIVATDLPTIAEVLNDSNAVIVPPGDTTAIAGALRLLMEDAELAARVGAQGERDVHAYSWQERSKRVLAFINNAFLLG